MVRTLNKRAALTALLLLLLTVGAAGQARINTKRVRLSDFTTLTTKVVTGGNPMLDATLQEAVSSRWTISPYEFCSPEEFATLRERSDCYLLMLNRADGVISLTLFKGGKENTPNHIGETFDVAELPVCSAGWLSSGREFALLPALIDILQDYVRSAMISDKVGYGGIGAISLGLGRAATKRVIFDPEDLAAIDDSILSRCLGEDIVSTEDADSFFVEGAYNTLVGFTVAPSSPSNGDWCTKMLIDADTHELYWFSRHRISERKPAGFLARDLKRIHSIIGE